MEHPDSDHESEVIERSLTSTSSLVESESEEGYDSHNGSIFDSDESDYEVINPSIYHIMERYLGDPALSQFRGSYYFTTRRSKLTIMEIREV